MELFVVSSFYEGIGAVVVNRLKVFGFYSKPGDVFVSF